MTKEKSSHILVIADGSETQVEEDQLKSTNVVFQKNDMVQ